MAEEMICIDWSMVRSWTRVEGVVVVDDGTHMIIKVNVRTMTQFSSAMRAHVIMISFYGQNFKMEVCH